MSVGVNSTESVWLPKPSTVPAGGVYTKVPGTLAVALSWVELNGVPYEIGAGVGQLSVGLALVTATITGELVEPAKFASPA